MSKSSRFRRRRDNPTNAVRAWLRTALIAPSAGLVLLAAAAPAVAQEFTKVEDGAREQLPATPFVGIAYGFIWAALMVYVFVVARGLGRVQKDLRDLRRRLDQSPGEPPPSG